MRHPRVAARLRFRAVLLPAGAAVLLAAGRGGAAVDAAAGLVDLAAAVRALPGISRDAYPDADAVLVDEHTRIRYEADGTSHLWSDGIVKVLTESGKRQHRTYTFHFTLPYETVRVVRAEIIKADGSTVDVDVAAQSRVAIDDSQMHANIYNPNQRRLHLSLAGLEVGDAYRVLSHRHTVKPRVPDTWSHYAVFEYTMPLVRLGLEIRAPAALPLRHAVLREPVAGTVTTEHKEDADGRHYRWSVREVPRMFREPNMPALHTVVQRLLVSTIEDWETISRWYWNLCLPRLESTSPEMQDKVEELVAGAASDRERIERLFRFVSQEIRYMGITTEIEAPGYEPRDVHVTFRNRYGVCRDKAALLVAMLRMAGQRAYPVLVHVGPRKDEDVPLPYFNHAVVAVREDDGGYLLMDPTDENTTELLPAYLCNRSYLVAHPDGERLRTSPVDPASANLMTIRSEGAVADDGSLRMNTRLEFAGINDNAYRGYLARIRPEQRRMFFEGMLRRRVPGARIEDLVMEPEDLRDTGQLLRVAFTVQAPDVLTAGRDAVVLDAPWLGPSVGYANFVLGRTGLKERKYPLLTEVACGIDESFAVTLPAFLEAVSLPPGVAATNRQVSFLQTVEAAAGALIGTSAFRMDTVEFSPAEYIELKRLLKDIEYARRQKAVFGAPQPAVAHDAEILEDDTLVEVAGPTRWTARRRVRKRVLTYAGQKTHGELKFPHNPVWERVELERAAVTDVAGNTFAVSPEELNLMDAPWAGGAPRYPAGKILVASLPAVNVGSVIEYVVKTEAFDRPFFSMIHTFGGFDPVRTNRLCVVIPRDLALRVEDRTEQAARLKRSEDGEAVRLTWEALDPPVLRPEDALPPLWNVLPAVLLSSGRWTDYAATVCGHLERASRDRRQVRRRVRERLRGTSSPREKIQAVRDFVAQSIRSAGPAFSDLPLNTIAAADAVLDSGYGHSADRAVLLHACLSAAGFRPEFVLASRDGPRVEALKRPLMDFPQDGLFDFVLVRLREGGQTIYLNDTDQYAWLGTTGMEGRLALDERGAVFTVDVDPRYRDRRDSEYVLHIEESGDARIDVRTLYFGGEYAAFHRLFSELTPEERRRHYQELLGSLSQAAEAVSDLRTDTESYPGVREFSARLERFAVRSDGRLYFELPRENIEIVTLRSERREHPLYRSGRQAGRVEYRVFLPDTVQDVLVHPQDLEWTGFDGLGSVRWALERQVADCGAAVLRLSGEFSLNDAVVPADRYPALLEVDRRLRHARMRTIVCAAVDTDTAAREAFQAAEP